MSNGTNLLARTVTMCALLAAGAVPTLVAQRVSRSADQSTVTIESGVRLAQFDPAITLGAGLDGHEVDDIRHIYTPFNIAAMLSAGFGPVTFRLRTELAIATWHWNPSGQWSDAAHQQGYWVSDDHAAQPIGITFGYRLPRRGRTVDDAANDGYSRLDDGDTTSFWKSNPYLDSRYTHDDERDHPQWIVLDFGQPVPVDAIRILFGEPYPRRYLVEYWTGDQRIPIDYNPSGAWRTFPNGAVTGERGGTAQLRLAPRPAMTRSVRIVMYQGSKSAPRGTSDPRDSLGFAIREVFAGTIDARGNLHDEVRHASVASAQTAMLVSSTDPWHRAVDRDSGIAQPGFDMVMRTGVSRGLPILVPTGLLFDTPENVAAEVRFLRSRGYPLAGIELGEEPDGQRTTPEDYAALYAQFATVIRTVAPGIRLGGPSMQSLRNDPLNLWPARTAAGSRTTWLGRFLDYLDHHGRTRDFNFFSFEWYPFDNVCDDPARNLAAAPGKLAHDLTRLRGAGLPDSIPRIMTEYGYSAHISTAEVTLPGALFDATAVPTFLAGGGSRAFYFGYEPGRLSHESSCPHWGNLLMLLGDSLGQARDRLPRYYGARMLTTIWPDSGGGVHELFQARVSARRGEDTLLSAFPLRRPDGRWSVLLVNRDPRRARSVDVKLNEGSRARSLSSPVEIWQYSTDSYRFAERNGPDGRPTLDKPPTFRTSPTAISIAVPPYSITVVVGR